MNDAKKYYITIDGEDIEVTEELYYAYKRPAWRESKRAKIRSEYEYSYEAMLEEGLDVASDQASVDEIVETKMMIELMKSLLTMFDTDDRELINELYFNEKTERQVEITTGIAQTTINYRKRAMLEKLRYLMKMKL